MIRYPELVVIGQTHSGKTLTLLEAAILHQRLNPSVQAVVFVSNETTEQTLMELGMRIVLNLPQTEDLKTVIGNTDADVLTRAYELLPIFTTPKGVETVLRDLNPSGEAGSPVVVFVDAVSLCALELNNDMRAGSTRNRFGVNIADPLGELLKHYSVKGVTIQNYTMGIA